MVTNAFDVLAARTRAEKRDRFRLALFSTVEGLGGDPRYVTRTQLLAEQPDSIPRKPKAIAALLHESAKRLVRWQLRYNLIPHVEIED